SPGRAAGRRKQRPLLSRRDASRAPPIAARREPRPSFARAWYYPAASRVAIGSGWRSVLGGAIGPSWYTRGGLGCPGASIRGQFGPDRSTLVVGVEEGLIC